MEKLKSFDFKGNKLQPVIGKDGEPWFIAKEVSEILDYRMASDMTRFLDEDEKGTHSVRTLRGDQKVIIISESGLYSAILRSKKPEAKEFKRWVTHEVLPEIRKNGIYISDAATDDQKRFNYKMLDVTFADCPLEKLSDTYKECLEFHRKNKTRILYAPNSQRRSDAHHTQSESMIMIIGKIEKTLEERRKYLLKPETVGLCLTIDEVLKVIKEDIGKQKVRSSRSKIGNKTRKIQEKDKQLKNIQSTAQKLYDTTIENLDKVYDYWNPPIEQYNVLPIHPFSVNYVDRPIYQQWKQAFRTLDVIVPESIDWSRPVDLWLKFDMQPKYDVANMQKTAQDMISSVLGVDDRLFQPRDCSVNRYVDDMRDGKIYYIIRQANINIA